MIKSVTEAHVQRPHDGSRGRQPLRLEIGRRRARTRAGREKFVTQVRFGGSTALVVPWREDRVAADRAMADRAMGDRAMGDRVLAA